MKPMIHILSNMVSMSDMAQMANYYGLSPIMSTQITEWPEIYERAKGLIVNIGTNDGRDNDLYLKAVRMAKERKIPVVLDPVGCGMLLGRKKLAESILATKAVSVLKCNASELYALRRGALEANGIDSHSHNSLEDLQKMASEALKEWSCQVVVTGERDLVSTYAKSFLGPKMENDLVNVVGSGCMLSIPIMRGLLRLEETANLPTLVNDYKNYGAEALTLWRQKTGVTYKQCWLSIVEKSRKEVVDCGENTLPNNRQHT